MASEGMELKIAIKGLKEANRSLRAIDKEAPKGLRLALNEAANLLIDRTRPLMPKRTGKAARSLKAKSTRTSARISMGGRLAPHTPWLDFGGRVGRKRSVVRPFIREGRYLYPTLRRERDDIEKILQSSLVNVVRHAGLEVS